MNSSKLMTTKLSELVELARLAETEFEAAAVFAACTAIAREFEANEDDYDPYVMEKVEQARWHTCAAVGYDIDNGHDKEAHIVWALGAVQSLGDALNRKRG
jgi:hypothetical protein